MRELTKLGEERGYGYPVPNTGDLCMTENVSTGHGTQNF